MGLSDWRAFLRGGVGLKDQAFGKSTMSAPPVTTPEGPIFPEDDTFSISVNAAYPLFEGGRRKADLGRARSDEETLKRR